MTSSNRTRRTVFIIVICVIIVLVLLLLYKIRGPLTDIIIPVLASIIIAYILNPLINYLEKYIPRVIAVILLYVLVMLMLIVFIYLFLPRIAQDFSEFLELIPEYSNEYRLLISKYQKSFNRVNLPNQIKQSIVECINYLEIGVIEYLEGFTINIVKSFPRFLGFIIVPVLTFYFLKDAGYFQEKLSAVIPKHHRKIVYGIIKDINLIIGRFIRGQLIVALIVGTMSVIGLYFVGIEYALILGIIAGIFNVIPYFGPIIGSIPAVIVGLLQSPIKMVLVIIVFTIVQQIESGFITPKIIGNSIGIHPASIIISLLVGARFFGIFGMLFAVPVVAILKVVFFHLLRLIV